MFAPTDIRSPIDWRRKLIPLFVLFAVEAAVFYGQLSVQITPFYPMNFDQAGYIDQVYSLYLSFVDHGWSYLFAFPFVLKNAGEVSIGAGTGVGLLMQGVLAAIVGGPGRASLLTLNLIYFYALQVALFVAIGVRTRNTNFSWLAIALLIASVSIFSPAGGIFDFRFDFSAFCLYGVWASLIVSSQVFRDTRLSYATAAMAALLIVVRYIAAPYVAVTLATALLVLLVASRSSNPIAARLARFRSRNLMLSSVLTFVLLLPFLIPASIPFFDKYVGGHLKGWEKYMRATEVGAHTLTDHILFYPKHIVWTHLGALTLSLVAVLVVIVVLSVVASRVAPSVLWRRVSRYRYEFVALIAAIILPQIILAADIAKSTVVGGIVLGPVILAFVLLVAALWPRDQPAPGARYLAAAALRASQFIWGQSRQVAPADTGLLTGVRIAVVAVAFMGFLANSTIRQHQYSRVELDSINDINTSIVRYALNNQIANPQFSIDRVVDYLNPSTLSIAAFERFNTALPIKGGLGYDVDYAIGPTPRDVAVQLAEKSDILVLTSATIEREAPYPLNAAVKEYWSELQTWAQANRDILSTSTILGVPYHVFVKPQVRIQGASGGWITRAGITIEANQSQLNRWPFIVLSGEANFDILGGVPRARADVFDDLGRPQGELPALLKPVGYRYDLIVDTRSRASTPSGLLKILVTFDRSFVPKQLGINADTRHLVMFAPASRELRAKAPD